MSLHVPTRARRLSLRATLLHATGIAAILAVPLTVGAQMGAGVARATRLEPTTSAATAATEFHAAMNDLHNVQVQRGLVHLRRALDADASLGIARVYFAINAPGMTRAQRDAELDRGVTDAARASTAELLVASAVRARFRGEFTQAQSLFRSAAAILPDDPNIAHQLATLSGQVASAGYTATIAPLRTVTTRFPDYAAAYNSLAYNLWRSGDRGGAMRAVLSYVEKAPNEPNAHDSHGELLQWSGRYDEALAAYRRSLQLDPSFAAALRGIARVEVLQGKSTLARTSLNEAIPKLVTPADKLSFRRQVAHSLLLDGDAKATKAEIVKFIDEAKAADQPAAVNGGHVAFAVVDALLADGRAVEGHLAMVTAEAPAIERAYMSALSYALAKQNAKARASLGDLNKALMGNTDANSARLAATVSALILINEGKGADAAVEISKTDLATPMTRAVLALAEQQRGNLLLARSLRDEILGDRNLNLDDGGQVTARRLVTRII